VLVSGRTWFRSTRQNFITNDVTVINWQNELKSSHLVICPMLGTGDTSALLIFIFFLHSSGIGTSGSLQLSSLSFNQSGKVVMLRVREV
jgi:hypothetical protein